MMAGVRVILVALCLTTPTLSIASTPSFASDGTHDNDTTVGWWNSGATQEEKAAASAYLGIGEDGVHWAFIRAALTSVANQSVVPVQDVLGLDSEARMNVPSQTAGNWSRSEEQT